MPPAATSVPASLPSRDSARGPWLVLASAVIWSFGGTFARFLGALDPWTVVFWRAAWAVAFLAGFMLSRDGPKGMAALFRAMGRPGLVVAFCFALASTSFVVALGLTSVANVLLIQAGVPLIAALLAWAAFGERVSGPTWAAIAAVLAGVAIMVSDGLGGGRGALPGNALAVLIALAFATATVVTRRHAGVRMVPAVTLGMLISGAAAGLMLTISPGPGLAVSPGQMALLAGFGGLSLGLGLALFVTGAPLVPSAVAALLGTAETMLGPFWVWLILGETPGPRTLLGGGVVLGALVAHLLWQIAARGPRASG